MTDRHLTPTDPSKTPQAGDLGPALGVPRADWSHLKRYGYAPGHYMNKCHRCMQVVGDLDKRATICRPCAEAMDAERQQPDDDGAGVTWA